MTTIKTPGVYIVEKNAFPNSVVEVATAVPAFVGHTEKAANMGSSLLNKPRRISSMAEYATYFGGAPQARFLIEERTGADVPAAFTANGTGYAITQPNGAAGGRFLLHRSMQLFFQNGGGPCYVVSVGGYDRDVAAPALTAGIDTLLQEQEPTLLVMPDAVLLDEAECVAVQQAMLTHCGGRMRNRMAILDVWGGARERSHPQGDPITRFRDALGINHLDFAAAYYPWLHTTVVDEDELSHANIINTDMLDALGVAATATAQTSPLLKIILAQVQRQLNLLPPAAAMAGIYTMVDNTRGVWKAPANVGLNSVVSPAVNITHEEQEDLNVTPQGKSINAIRSFVGEGVLVWGARTLDGNSLDWRYINVRRTMIMLEESCRLAAKAMAFEPNEANTWVTIKSMLANFLTGIWKRGGLAGTLPEDAFSVHVGLGETMTPEDIAEGILRVTVLVAISRPAEFIEITLQQQMQKG
jgi:uncharacterized protein